MKKIIGNIRPYIKETVLSPLLKMFEALLELIVPLVIANIIDSGIKNKSVEDVVYSSLFLVLLGAVGLGASVLAQYYAAKASCGFSARLRHQLFAHVQTLSYTELDRLGPSTLITRMTSDTNQVQTGLNLTLRLLMRSPFVVFGAMIMAFTIDTGIALTFVGVIAALSVIVFGIMLLTIPLYKRVQMRLDKVLLSTRENLSGARVIRAFCMEEDEARHFKARNEALAKHQRFVGGISALMNPMTYVVVNIAIIFLIHQGAIQVDLGGLTQGEVIALYNYMSQILVELIKLANLIISITKALASASRIETVLDVSCSMTFGEKKFSGIGEGLVFDNVSFSYVGAQEPSLKGASFTVSRGETVGIIGGTGSGKTTLINLIPRFYDVTEGKITVDGTDICDFEKDSLREKIGIVTQKSALFSGTIRDNLLWGNKNATDEELLQAVRLAQAADVLEAKGGLDAEIEAGGRNLSGGQRQRLTIARALVRHPEILILDDAASALDFATDRRLRCAIDELSFGGCVFIVSQRASSVMNADKIIVLDDAEICAIGTHTELLSSCEVYREIYNTQFTETPAGTEGVADND
ncbi:MAG: ABC transporter ATP-binding protein [Clostridia bacterium]|nr:ABC transporter ATP-binding protein [Clostridia bacterium]